MDADNERKKKSFIVQSPSLSGIAIKADKTSPLPKSKSDDSFVKRSREKNSTPITPPNMRVVRTKLNMVNISVVKPRRAGVILYTTFKGHTFFGLGVDAPTHDITDFGGFIDYDTDTNVIRGAMREFREETLNIFGNIHPSKILDCPVIYDNDNLIIFLRVDINPDDISIAFNKKYEIVAKDTSKRIEVCAITWLTWTDFRTIINTAGTMYERVRRFLQRSGDISLIL